MKPFLIVVTVCAVLTVIIAPPGIALLGVFFLFFVPGFVMVSFLLPQKDFLDHVILSVLTGLAFQVVYAYILSVKFHFSLLTLLVPAVGLAVLFDFKGTWNPEINKKTFLILVPALLFGAATLNLVPGEDANFHLLALGDITEVRAVPQAYSLYPEIPAVMYPLGFHVLTAQLQLFSGMDNLIFTFASVVSVLLCLSVYWCTKKLFNLNCGLLAGVLSVFATLTPLNSIILSTYGNLLVYVFACTAIGIIADFDKNMNWKPLLLLSVVLAAGIETHLSFFLIAIPISLFFIAGIIKKTDHLHKNLKYVFVPGLSIVLSAPFLLRISAGYTPYEVERFLSLWFDPLKLTPDMIPQQVGIWIILVSIPGLFLLEKHRVLFISWIGVFLFLAVNTVLRIQFPLWYVFFATRMVDQLFLPFSIVGAFFLTQIWKFSRAGTVLLCGILLLAGSSPLVSAPRADRGEIFPTISYFFATDQEGMVSLLDTDEDAVILNEWWTATGSAWIPSLARRRVIFPYVFSLEHYMSALDIPERERQGFVIAAFPDSQEACTYLKDMDVDYIFLSSYVLDEAKWRNKLWNPFILMESPHYEKIFEKGYTYIFEVVPYSEYTTSYVLHDYGSFTVSGTRVLDILPGEVSFPVNMVLDIFIEDNGWQEVELYTGESVLAVVPLINTGTATHVAFRLPDDVQEITISTEEPVRMAASISVAFWDSIPLESSALVGTSWEKTARGYELKDQGHIYLFNTSKTVEITYIDTGEGNIDFNVFIDGEWKKLITIYRENDGETKTILLDIPDGYTLLDIGVNTWKDPFILIDVIV
jgi:hypothetical protein